ncbi:MAG: helix-turn-helix domain-containing protein [Bacteriovoracaceae bacterium]|nr:helix-turn-helix domain-containing protein [Bacteriovoracaceae bacterium]
MKNYYEILEVSPNSTQKEITFAYQKIKSAYSQNGLALYSLIGEGECSKMLELIDESYNILSSPVKRKRYDEVRGLNHADQDQGPAPTSISSLLNKHLEQQDGAPSSRPNNERKSPSSTKNIAKIIATKRFALSYDIDPEFEKEIEQTTEFTGEFLQRIREYKKIDILRLADMTKVSKVYLSNIEKEELEGLPALAYVRGFVYQYAKCLKLNPDLVATSYIYRLKKMKT